MFKPPPPRVPPTRGYADLVAPIRTYANAIIGFAEMLESPEITLSEAKRREYVAIVRLSGAALDKHIREALRDENDDKNAAA